MRYPIIKNTTPAEWHDLLGYQPTLKVGDIVSTSDSQQAASIATDQGSTMVALNTGGFREPSGHTTLGWYLNSVGLRGKKVFIPGLKDVVCSVKIVRIAEKYVIAQKVD